MKVIVVKNNLKKGLEAVIKVSGENTHLPVLKNILVKAEDNTLKFSTTNLESAIIYSCSAKIIESGELTAPALILNSIVNNLSSDIVNLELKKDILNFKTDNYEANINTLPVEDFPIIPVISKGENEYMEFNSDILKESLNQVLSAVKVSDLRPEINGVLFLLEDEVLKLVGTDSFRLGEKRLTKDKFVSTIKNDFKNIIPIKTIQELLSILPSGIKVRIYFDENQVLFKTVDFSLISRLIDGEFPDYKQIIPKDIEVEVIVRKSELMDGLKVTSVLSGKVNDVEIIINEKFLELSSVNQGVGENKYLVPAKIKGTGFNVRFNWNYILAGVKSLRGDSIWLGINKDNKPSIIKVINNDSYFYLLMPVKG